MYSLIIFPKAQKQLSRLPLNDRLRVIAVLRQIREDPYEGKPLQGKHKGFFTARVWPYRIVYCIDHKIVTVNVIAIGHRKDIYKKLIP